MILNAILLFVGTFAFSMIREAQKENDIAPAAVASGCYAATVVAITFALKGIFDL